MRKSFFTSIIIAMLMSGAILPNYASSARSEDSPPAIEWQRLLPNAGDAANSIVQTDDGYVVAGMGNSKSGSPRAYLFKLDSYGNMQWNRSYSTGNIAALIQTTDGGYALDGSSELIKTDSEGNVQWSKAFSDVYIASMVQSADGGYALAGYKAVDESDFWLAKLDSSGALLWTNTFGGEFEDRAFSVVQADDGGYALAGKSDDFFSARAWLVKTDAVGNLEWSETFGGPGESQANSIIQTSDGDYVLAGKTNVYGAGGNDAWLIKTDSSGSHLWNRTYGGTGELPDFKGNTLMPVEDSNGTGEDLANSLTQTSDGGLAFVGSSGYSMIDLVWLVKTDADGNAEWNATFGTFEGVSYRFEGNSLIETSDGGFAIAGYKQVPGFPWLGDYYIVKTEAVLPPPTPQPMHSPTASPILSPGLTGFLEIVLIVTVVVAIAGLGLLVYHKKRSREAEMLSQETFTNTPLSSK